MKTLKNKMKNKKGFTLMEMLIVVAIMVVLMAVAIPMFSGQLNNAKAKVDAANEKAAKNVAVTGFIAGTYTADTYYFNDSTGLLQKDTTGIVAYGQAQTGCIKVIIGNDGTVTTSWSAISGGGEG